VLGPVDSAGTRSECTAGRGGAAEQGLHAGVGLRRHRGCIHYTGMCMCVCVGGGVHTRGVGETPRLLADLPSNALAYRQSPYPSGPSVPASIYLHQFLTITPSACTRLPLFPCCCLQAVYPPRRDPRSTTLRTSSFLPLLPQTLNPSHHILPPPFLLSLLLPCSLRTPRCFGSLLTCVVLTLTTNS
jgi:hypothetical protein